MILYCLLSDFNYFVEIGKNVITGHQYESSKKWKNVTLF